MRIAYLASQQSLPGPAGRAVDILEHQQMMANLSPAFAALGCTVEDIAWDTGAEGEPSIQWAEFDAVLVGSTWDYCERHEEFLLCMSKINAQTPVFNSPEILAWNSHKGYLKQLARQGVNTVPTAWIDQPTEPVEWDTLCDQFNTSKLVAKRQIGANAEGQVLYEKGQPGPNLTHSMMVQPFLSAIVSEGEYSLIFIDGEFSHGLVKQPKGGDYRIQASYGGSETPVEMAKDGIDLARQALEAVVEMPLYARVDLVRGEDSRLAVMELELVEPFLYPMQSQRLGELMANALVRRMS